MSKTEDVETYAAQWSAIIKGIEEYLASGVSSKSVKKKVEDKRVSTRDFLGDTKTPFGVAKTTFRDGTSIFQLYGPSPSDPSKRTSIIAGSQNSKKLKEMAKLMNALNTPCGGQVQCDVAQGVPLEKKSHGKTGKFTVVTIPVSYYLRTEMYFVANPNGYPITYSLPASSKPSMERLVKLFSTFKVR